MRRLVITALAAAVPLVAASTALAAPQSTYKLTVSPAKKSQPVAVSLKLAYGDPSPGVVVSPLQFTDIYLPSGFKLNTKYQSNRKNQCDSKKVQQVTKNPTADCPLASLLGVGKASFVAAAGQQVIQANTVKITKPGAPNNGGVLVYNARVRTDVNKTADDSNGVAPQCKSKPTFFIYTNALVPVQDQRVFPGCFVTVGGRAVIRVPVYKILVAGLQVSVTKFEAKLKGFNSGTCPKSRKWTSKAITTFRKPNGTPGGPKYTSNSTAVRCS